MIYGHRFNIAHMPKTGGTWLRRVCERLPKGIIREIYPNHRSCGELTEAEAELPTYVFVRNPWDWYVSRYSHWHGNITKKRHEFRLPVENLLPRWQAVWSQYKGSFEESMKDVGLPRVDPHTKHDVRSFSDSFLSFSRMPEGAQAKVLLFEHGLGEGLLQILKESHPESITPTVERLLSEHQRENVSERSRDYASYYTPPLRDKVASLDARIIAEHGYTFATPSARLADPGYRA